MGQWRLGLHLHCCLLEQADILQGYPTQRKMLRVERDPLAKVLIDWSLNHPLPVHAMNSCAKKLNVSSCKTSGKVSMTSWTPASSNSVRCSRTVRGLPISAPAATGRPRNAVGNFACACSSVSPRQQKAVTVRRMLS